MRRGGARVGPQRVAANDLLGGSGACDPENRTSRSTRPSRGGRFCRRSPSRRTASSALIDDRVPRDDQCEQHERECRQDGSTIADRQQTKWERGILAVELVGAGLAVPDVPRRDAGGRACIGVRHGRRRLVSRRALLLPHRSRRAGGRRGYSTSLRGCVELEVTPSKGRAAIAMWSRPVSARYALHLRCRAGGRPHGRLSRRACRKMWR